MKQRIADTPVRFTPRGLVDSRDSTDKFAGACQQLSNLVFDQSNPEIMLSRPGVSSITAFPGFVTPGAVSVQITSNNRTYGMVASGSFAGKDEPFCYNHLTGAFEAVTGVTTVNTPTTQALTGSWTPPTMSIVGPNVLVTHPGFPGNGIMFGVMNITTPAAPSWIASDLTTNRLAIVPLAVANFQNRAYFATDNTLPYTDVLAPTVRTNASQVLTIGDTSPMTALAGLPVQTTSSGVLAALIAFKDSQVWQVTGDAATSNLALNFLSLNLGTPAQRSVAQSPLGLYFAAINGPYVIDQFGVLRALTYSGQESEPDIKVPWQRMVQPTRVAAGYSGGIYRICMETVVRGVQGFNDYWFDENRRRWNGPHTFRYDCASQYGNYFIINSNTQNPALIRSEVQASATTVYTDLGSTVSCTQWSSTFPKSGAMAVKQVVESTQEFASGAQAANFAVSALDDLGNTLDNVQISVLPAGSLWGTGIWGSFTWASSENIPTTYTVPWTKPLVFKKMAIFISVTASSSISMGTFYARYQFAGYTNTR